MAREEARRRARLDLGGIEPTEEKCRDARGANLVENFFQDLCYGLRMLWQNPGFTAAAVLAIALGLGINVGIFSVLNGAALRLLLIPRAEQVVSIDRILHGTFKRNAHNGSGMFSYSQYLDYRDQNHVFSGF